MVMHPTKHRTQDTEYRRTTRGGFFFFRVLFPVFCVLPLTACYLFYGSTPSVSDRDIPDHLKRADVAAPPIPDRHPYAPVRMLKAGTWARYRVTTASGSE